MNIFRTNAVAKTLRCRGVSADRIENYRKDTGHGFPHAEKVFKTSQKLLDLAGVKIKADDLRALSSMAGIKDLTHSLELACAIHDLTDSAKKLEDLDGIFPGLKPKITREEIGRFLVLGEYGVTREMIDHFYGQITQLSAAQGEIPVRRYHHLSAAILAYNLLAEDPTFEGKAVDAKLVALAILSHNGMNPSLVPGHSVIGALMDADTLAEFDIVRMIDININKAGRVLFDESIPWKARMEMLIKQRQPEEVEADPAYGRTGKWLDTFQYTMVRLISNLSNSIYRDPTAVSMLLGEENGLFDKALTDTIAAIKKNAKDKNEIAAIGKTLMRLINEAMGDAQYIFAVSLLAKAKSRIADELLWPCCKRNELPASLILGFIKPRGFIGEGFLEAGVRTEKDIAAVVRLVIKIAESRPFAKGSIKLPDSGRTVTAYNYMEVDDVDCISAYVSYKGEQIFVFGAETMEFTRQLAKAWHPKAVLTMKMVAHYLKRPLDN